MSFYLKNSQYYYKGLIKSFKCTSMCFKHIAYAFQIWPGKLLKWRNQIEDGHIHLWMFHTLLSSVYISRRSCEHKRANVGQKDKRTGGLQQYNPSFLTKRCRKMLKITTKWLHENTLLKFVVETMQNLCRGGICMVLILNLCTKKAQNDLLLALETINMIFVLKR